MQHTFCTKFFVIVLHVQTTKLLSYTFHGENVVFPHKTLFLLLVFLLLLFFHCFSFFILLATSISHFLTAAAIKFSCYSSSKIFFSFICFLSLPLALSVISMSVYTSKCSGKKDSPMFFFTLKM